MSNLYNQISDAHSDWLIEPDDDEETVCPDCGSPLENGSCTDVGGHCCLYLE